MRHDNSGKKLGISSGRSASLRTLLDLCDEGACLVEPADWRVVYANSRLLDWLGCSAARFFEVRLTERLPDLQHQPVATRLAQVIAGEIEETVCSIHWIEAQEGRALVEVRVRRVKSDSGVLLAVVLKSATAAKPMETTLSRTGIDPLTGLADRACLLERLSRTVRGDRSGDQRTAVLFIDVDGFKQINDAHGHLVGDRVLGEVAQRLAGSVRAGDFVARFGGDEFVVLVERVDGRKDFEPVVRRIETAFRRPIALPEGEVTLSVSIGAAQSGVDGDSAEALIDSADRAMYAVKRATA